MVREVYGSRVQIDTIYDVKEWGKGDAEVLKGFVDDGYSMIFACSFGYMKSVIQAAFQSPDVLFEHCGGYVRARNISTYTARTLVEISCRLCKRMRDKRRCRHLVF